MIPINTEKTKAQDDFQRLVLLASVETGLEVSISVTQLYSSLAFHSFPNYF